MLYLAAATDLTLLNSHEVAFVRLEGDPLTPTGGRVERLSVLKVGIGSVRLRETSCYGIAVVTVKSAQV